MLDGKIFQVSEFIEFINIYLGATGEVVITGEISEINVSQSKWIFITIKDSDSNLSVFGVVGQISTIRQLEPGMQVAVYGNPRLHKKSGRFSIYAHDIVPSGTGALKIAFEKLRRNLEAEGLFDAGRKRNIPLIPRKIGLITADGSRAYSDFMKILNDRPSGMKILFYPVQVQGRVAGKSIIRSISYFNRKTDVDLLVMIRGGGSLEDLMAYNDEEVVRAIYGSKIPVICGIGHEDDITLADLVCDKRASTPTNAAGLVMDGIIDMITGLEHNVTFCQSKIQYRMLNTRHNVLSHISSLKSSIKRQMDQFRLIQMELLHVGVSFTKKINVVAESIINNRDKIIKKMRYSLRMNHQKRDALTRIVKNLDYNRLLSRGYSITTVSGGRIIRHSNNLKQGDVVYTKLFTGSITSTVIK